MFPLVALTRFKRTLRRARLSVRQLTHTLHLPPALSEIYGGPNSSWLRDVLEYLPNLQSLIVSQLPFFDHHSLIALRYASSTRRSSLDSENERPQYDLKLLLAEREPNITSVGLREALFHFPHLVYLDLSYTSPVRGFLVLSALANLWDLQVLKLKGVGMRDGEAEVLANAIGIRVRLLDLRENHLTDMAVRSLMQACFLPPDRHPNSGSMNTRQIEDWPVGIPPGPDLLSLDSLRSEELDRELLKQLTHPLTGRLAFEDIPHKGLTHLYIADNNLSVEGLSSLLKSTRLHVLDGGSVDNMKSVSQTMPLLSPTGYHDEVRLPGAEKLAPVLATYASHNLTYLRISHTVVSKSMPTKEVPSPTVSAVELEPGLSAVLEAPAPAHYAVELPPERELRFELSGEPLEPKSELPGDCIHFALSPPVNLAPHPNVASGDEEAGRPNRGDGAFAPEVVTNRTTAEEEEQEEVVLNASGSGLSSTQPLPLEKMSGDDANTSKLRRESSDHKTDAAARVGQSFPSPSASRLARIESLLKKRPVKSAITPNGPDTAQTDLSNSSNENYTYLHPSHLPNLRTLVLAGVPLHVPSSSKTIAALLRFISACADEAYLARLLAHTNYSLPPGHSRRATELQHARSLFALRTIVLEMGDVSSQNVLKGKAWEHSRAKLNMLRSSTGDRDSEALWSAAENDFSFFGEEGEEENECGIYRNEPDKYFPTARMDEKIVWDPDDELWVNSNSNVDARTFDSHHRRSPTTFSPNMLRSPTLLQSPRNLPLGKNRKLSTSASNRKTEGSTSPATSRNGSPLPAEAPTTTTPTFHSFTPTSPSEHEHDEPLLDVVAELAKFRKQKKHEYETALAAAKEKEYRPFIEGHWDGEIKIIRNAAPKGRSGVVDMYGNYFEKGYLYP